jgi:hypothetical protein
MFGKGLGSDIDQQKPAVLLTLLTSGSRSIQLGVMVCPTSVDACTITCTLVERLGASSNSPFSDEIVDKVKADIAGSLIRLEKIYKELAAAPTRYVPSVAHCQSAARQANQVVFQKRDHCA